MKRNFRDLPWLVIWRLSVLGLLLWIVYELRTTMPSDVSSEISRASDDISDVRQAVDGVAEQVKSLANDVQALRWRTP